MSSWERIKNISLLRKVLYFFIGIVTYPGLVFVNKLRVSGTEHIKGLPKTNVLLVSNHQTYFADVIAMLHILSAVKWGRVNRLGFPIYLLNAFTRVNYVAAEETMKKNWLSKLFTLGGAITVKRPWTGKPSEQRKGLDPSDSRKIARALEKNWVIQFPQGTTTPFAPGRKGTAHLIKLCRPIVIPVVIDGFSAAFDKKGLKFKKRGTELSVQFKECLPVDYDAPVEDILEQILVAIGQKRL